MADLGESLKEQKIKFVSNLNGGTVAEITTVALVAPCAVLVWSVLQSRIHFFTPYTPSVALIDFLLQCGAILFATTVYSSAPLLLILLLLVPAIGVYLTTSPIHKLSKSKPPKLNPKNDADSKLDPYPIKPFLTSYRGAMIIVTCVAILAVDFHVFPRRFAKVETWGTSLMDMGVGSFVFTAGTVSVRSMLKDKDSGRSNPFAKRFIASLRHSTPLLILGLIRLYSVKGLDYAEHVTEYGVHWNFFFTLGLLPPFMAIFQSLFAFIPSYAALALILSLAYEIILDQNNTRLKAFILYDPRTDLFSSNREGIFSFIGYLAIFLAGQSVGTFALPRQKPIPKNAPIAIILRTSILARLAIWTVVWTALYLSSTSLHAMRLDVSRRFANLPYVLWVSSFNTLQLTIFCAVETVCFPNIYDAETKEEEKKRIRAATSTVLHAFNRNGLPIFLVANLLTGAVNMSVNTLDVRRIPTMIILVAYMSAVTGVALGCEYLDLSIKF